MIYGDKIQKVQLLPYRIKHVSSLKIIEAGDLSYEVKWLERSQLEKCYQKKGDCDDIILLKNGLVTDAYYANLLFLQKGKWFTPKSPLLHGVQRQILLETKKIKAIDIPAKDIKKFTKVKLINAMLDLQSGPEVSPGNIYF